MVSSLMGKLLPTIDVAFKGLVISASEPRSLLKKGTGWSQFRNCWGKWLEATCLFPSTGC